MNRQMRNNKISFFTLWIKEYIFVYAKDEHFNTYDEKNLFDSGVVFLLTSNQLLAR